MFMQEAEKTDIRNDKNKYSKNKKIEAYQLWK